MRELMSKAKWILGGLGFVLGGPIGALIGVALGALYDGFVGTGLMEADETGEQSNPRNQQSNQQSNQRTTGQATAGDINISFLVLIACVMKADGRVLKSEVNFVKPYLVRLYGETGAKQALQLLKDLLGKDIDYVSVCTQIKQHVNYSTLLEIVHLLLDLANADGDFAAAEQTVIRRMATLLGLTTKDYDALEALYKKTRDPNWAYQALEIEPSDTDDEVKKAYRRMAMKYHPDKVATASEQVRQKATEKFRAINEAYEHIKLLRNIK